MQLQSKGKKVVLVVSGAKGSGWPKICDKKSKDKMLSIVSAMVGQIPLIGAYANIFQEHGLIVGQLLFTQEQSMSSEKRIKQVIKACFDAKVIPVINYNDPLHGAEIFFDNDFFAHEIALILGAKRLLILTSRVNGLLNIKGKLVPVICLEEIDSCIDFCSVKEGDSTGSMWFKLVAGKHFIEDGGIICVIGNIKHRAYNLLYRNVTNCTTILDLLPKNYFAISPVR